VCDGTPARTFSALSVFIVLRAPALLDHQSGDGSAVHRREAPKTSTKAKNIIETFVYRGGGSGGRVVYADLGGVGTDPGRESRLPPFRSLSSGSSSASGGAQTIVLLPRD